MLKKLLVVAMVVAPLAVDSYAADLQLPSKVVPAAWRGGYRYRRYSTSATTTTTRNFSGNQSYSSNRNYGRSSPLDYPAYSQPSASRNHQWNKYPNQPYYLRGERKSLGILP
jgi:hypothetical protein